MPHHQQIEITRFGINESDRGISKGVAIDERMVSTVMPFCVQLYSNIKEAFVGDFDCVFEADFRVRIHDLLNIDFSANHTLNLRS